MPILESRIPIKLDKERTMVFNANTMCAYEEATGNFFLDTVATLYDALRAATPVADQGQAPPPRKSGFDIVRKVPMKELRALLWASLHEYDENDEPYWPLTINQVGRLIRPMDVARVFFTFLEGQTKNAPTREQLGESQAPPPQPEANPAEEGAAKTIGGVLSTESLEGALG